MADQVECQGVWKIYGKRATESLAIIEQRGLTKDDAHQELDCVIGARDASFTVNQTLTIYLSFYCSRTVGTGETWSMANESRRNTGVKWWA